MEGNVVGYIVFLKEMVANTLFNFQLRNEVVNNKSALDVISKHCFTKKSSAGNLHPKTRKKSKLFQCLSRDESSFSEKRLTLRSSSNHRLLRNGSTHHGTEGASVNPSLDNRNSTSTAVAAVKALIAQTKELQKPNSERHKRGEYHRYTPEIKEAIAIHAMRYGTHDAARTFSTSLGRTLSTLQRKCKTNITVPHQHSFNMNQVFRSAIAALGTSFRPITHSVLS